MNASVLNEDLTAYILKHLFNPTYFVLSIERAKISISRWMASQQRSSLHALCTSLHRSFPSRFNQSPRHALATLSVVQLIAATKRFPFPTLNLPVILLF